MLRLLANREKCGGEQVHEASRGGTELGDPPQVLKQRVDVVHTNWKAVLKQEPKVAQLLVVECMGL